MKQTIADALRASKALIEKYGWVQCAYGSKESGYCAAGAISVAVACSGDTYERTLNLLRRANEIKSASIWNDKPERTVQDVYAAFDRAIALAVREAA